MTGPQVRAEDLVDDLTVKHAQLQKQESIYRIAYGAAQEQIEALQAQVRSLQAALAAADAVEESVRVMEVGG